MNNSCLTAPSRDSSRVQHSFLVTAVQRLTLSNQPCDFLDLLLGTLFLEYLFQTVNQCLLQTFWIS